MDEAGQQGHEQTDGQNGRKRARNDDDDRNVVWNDDPFLLPLRLSKNKWTSSLDT